MPQTEGFTLPRQHNTFYYLSGIETPGAYLLLDGRTKKVTIYLPARNPRLEAAEGRVLSAEDADLVMRISGVDEVQPLQQMVDTNWPLIGAGEPAPGGRRTRPAAGGDLRGVQPGREPGPEPRRAGRRPKPRASTTRGTAPDRGSGGSSSCCGRVIPRAELRNLNPILDEMRSIKSPREIAMVRRASQIAGLGLMEAMRSTEPGVTEYQLDAAARYVFLRERRAARGLSLDHRERHREHQQHALLPQHLDAEGRRPGADGLRARTTATTSATSAASGRSTASTPRSSASCCSSCSSSTRRCCRASVPA